MVRNLWGVERMATWQQAAVRYEGNDPVLKQAGLVQKQAYKDYNVLHFVYEIQPKSAMTSNPHSDNSDDSLVKKDNQFSHAIDKLFTKMKAEFGNSLGKRIGYTSGYRDYQYVVNRWKAIPKSSVASQIKSLAPPHSTEHHSGYAIDIIVADSDWWNSANGRKVWDWLLRNGPELGFVQSFTAAAKKYTGVIEERWHWKWLGNTSAIQALTPKGGTLAAQLVISMGGDVQKAAELAQRLPRNAYYALRNDLDMIAMAQGKPATTGSPKNPDGGDGGDGGTSGGSTSSDTTGGGGGTASNSSTSTTARKPTNTGAPSVCKTLEVDPRVKEAFELAFKALYPDGKVDFGPVPTSQQPLGQTTPPPAGPGSSGYTQTPSPGSTVGEDGKIPEKTESTESTGTTENTGEAK